MPGMPIIKAGMTAVRQRSGLAPSRHEDEKWKLKMLDGEVPFPPFLRPGLEKSAAPVHRDSVNDAISLKL